MLSTKSKKLLNIPIESCNKKEILEKIKIYINHPTGFLHIVSLNPENLVLANENQEFKKVIETAQIKINDGIGVVIASRWLGIEANKVTGVGLMNELLELADEKRLRVLLIGGRTNLALELADCYQQQYPKAKFFGTTGIKNIQKPTEEEEKQIFSIVVDMKPNILIAAFGSPMQEIWLARHSKQLSGTVCLGVGGAFDFLSGKIPRAPVFLQKIGLEWLYRLVRQPRRWRRQLRLVKFVWLVIKQKYGKGNHPCD